MKDIVKKWWFWVCLVLITLIVSFVILMVFAFNTATSGISGVALEILHISENAILYSSAGETELILKIEHFDKLEEGQPQKIMNILKSYKDTILSSYKKLIVISMIDNKSDTNKANYLILYQEYNMSDFSTPTVKQYIDFSEYEELFNTYDKTMNSYTDLFNSIY